MPILSNDNPPNLTHVYISSRDRLNLENSTTTDFAVVGPPILQARKVILVRVCFVHTLYNVNDNNNILYAGTWNSSKSLADQVKTPMKIAATNGNYDIDTFVPAFQAQLRSFFATSDIVVSWDAKTYKLLITSPTVQPVFYGKAYGTTASVVLGIDDRFPVMGRGYPADTLGSGNISQFGNTFNFLGYNNLFLCSEYLSRGGKTLSTSPGLSNIICMVPLTGTSFGQIIELSPNHVYEYDRAANIDFRLVDNLGRTVDLNGGNLNITLAIITDPETSTNGY